jgi:alpha-galactosidase
MTLCTQALYHAEPDIKAMGCCHETFGTQWHLARLASDRFGAKIASREEVSMDVAGVNHFTFVTRAEWDGHDLFPLLRERMSRPRFFAARRAKALERKRQQQWFSCDQKIAYDFLNRFGDLGAAGDRHLAEFVPWYLSSEDEILRWGVVLTPYSWRLRRERAKKVPKVDMDAPLRGTNEEGTKIMAALVGAGPAVCAVNVPNAGQVRGMPPGWVVETHARLSKDSLRPRPGRPLSPGVLSLQRRVVDVQAMTLRAAVERDGDLAFQALLADPLVRIPTDRARRMFTEMLRHTRKMLPGWKT